jgi:nucleotide-binding universal stress UspA family protein
MTTITRILVPFDFGEASVHALDIAKSMAERFEATLDVLHVVPNPYMGDALGVYVPLPPEFLDGLVREAEEGLAAAMSAQDRQRFKARLIVKVGDARFEILQHARAEAVDLIVMGTHGRGAMGHLVLGSVAERVVRTASCPVLTVR